MRAVVDVRDVPKRVGDVDAVRGVWFAVEEGGGVRLPRTQGAWKTTTIRCLLEMLLPTRGSLGRSARIFAGTWAACFPG